MNTPSPAAGAGASLTAAQRATLRLLVGMLVPASPDGRMPAAADMPQVVRHLEHLHSELPALGGGLDLLESLAMARYGAAFAALDHARRSSVLDEFAARDPTVLQRLALET
ncbi:MAG TPA: gluconate 2-dehydrogenase subunit 3 family protein, partial [Ramlibacter sp.]|nr:gluconate 2-dehydrogenase subunit 3 family protein [Ramlibacter sp.]